MAELNVIKILIAIPNYNNNQIELLKKCISEYNFYSLVYKIDIYLLETEQNDIVQPNIYHIYYDKNIKYNLAFEHRKLFELYKNSYDYYIYCEDDILIPEITFKRYLFETNLIDNDKFIYGFLRYEMFNNIKYFIDLHPAHSVHRGINSIINYNDSKYFEPVNVHQGCYILTKEQLNNLLSNTNYLNNTNRYAGILETAASDVFIYYQYRKRINWDYLFESTVYHLSNKYACKNEYNICPTELTINQLKNN